MAQEDSIRTFSTIAPSRMAHSPYASAYANLAENVGDEWVDSRKLRDVMEVARFMSQEDRAKKEEKRQAFYEDLRNRAETRAQERADRYAARQDYKEHLMDQADQLIGKIEMIDPLHKDASKALQDLRSSQNFGRLLANRDTRQAVLEAFKNKAKEHDAILGGFMQEGQSKYGFSPSIDQVPVNEDGTFDTAKFYSETLPSLAQQMQQKAQQTYDTAQPPEGMQKYAQYDEYGRPIAKFTKAPAMGSEERVQVASDLGLVPSGISAGGQVVYSRPKEKKKSGLEELSGVSSPPPTTLPSPTPEATNDASPSPTPMPLGDIFK